MGSIPRSPKLERLPPVNETVDVEAIAAGYKEEREKRLRVDGTDQYQSVDEGFLNHFSKETWSEPINQRPVEETIDFLIVGAGYSGMILAVRLLQAGITNIEIGDKSGDFGGTWYWNDSAKKWDIGTSRGDKISEQFVTTAGGLLHKMKFPGVPGIEKFKGHSFHTSRWDFDYTGGDVSGNLHRMTDKRVGIIGTGAAAIQVVPHLGEHSKHLYMFQRTPSSIDVRLGQPTDPEWSTSLKKGWQQDRMHNFNNLVAGAYVEEDLVADGWTESFARIMVNAKMVAETEKAANPKMDQIRRRVDATVKDHKTAEALKPWYNYMRKRPAFHNAYLPTFNRQNVTLVDTEGRGVERITEKGIVFNGKEYELDCIVYATGFEYVSNDYSKRLHLDVRGRNEVTLNQHWKDGPRTLHGIHTRNFPNHFIMSITQSALAPNFKHLLNEQAKHIAFITAETLRRGATTVETSQESEDEWIRTIIRLGRLREGLLRECTPSYYSDEGKISERTLRSGRYGLGAPHFFQLLQDWRDKWTVAGLELDGQSLVPGIAYTDENIRVLASSTTKERKLNIPEGLERIDNSVPAI
ncbi:hypothetical protein FOBRF1_009140 [Fusarium oxysporum]